MPQIDCTVALWSGRLGVYFSPTYHNKRRPMGSYLNHLYSWGGRGLAKWHYFVKVTMKGEGVKIPWNVNTWFMDDPPSTRLMWLSMLITTKKMLMRSLHFIKRVKLIWHFLHARKSKQVTFIFLCKSLFIDTLARVIYYWHLMTF